jgi:hypothetical protein
MSTNPDYRDNDGTSHKFLIGGCHNQWHRNHNDRECWAEFLKFHGAPAGLTVTEFYDGLDNGGWK